MATPTITRSMLEGDIALLTFDTPGKGANVLSSHVLDELAEHLDHLQQQSSLAGVILCSGKPGMFIAGADLREFASSLDIPPEKTVAMCRRGQTLFGRFAQLPCVSVAAIDGICVGGGAEVTIWCDRRIMTRNPKTQFGFPEVKLGLFPGWGGTVRTPRIVGLANAVELITTGESIDADAAWAMGLVSDVVDRDQLLDAAVRLVRSEQQHEQYRVDRQRWSGPVNMDETELGFLGVTASAVIGQETKGHYPAPQAALEVMLEGALQDAESACRLEAEGMAQLFGSSVNAGLLNVFFLTDRNKKDTGIEGSQVQPRQLKRVGIVGAGIMGAGIAAANVKRQMPVVITDAAAEALQRGAQNVIEEVAYNKKTKSTDAHRAVQFAPLLSASQSDNELAACDLIIEAVVENADVKRKLYKRLEPQMADTAILASNTSTIPITQLAQHLKRPDRFCGIHFFNPVRRMQLVEVIRGQATSDETVATAVAYAKRIGKMPVVVNDGPGFLVNRLLFPYMHEAIELLSEGVPIEAIEKAARKFGMPMGPLTLYDVVGIDTALYAGRTMWEAYPDRIKASPLLPHMVKVGRLGQKSGAGFFAYPKGKLKGVPDPEFNRLLQPYVHSSQKLDPDQLTQRLILPMLLEATRLLQDEIVRDVRDVDLGLIFGIGFPPFRGGLLCWADTVGAEQILKMIDALDGKTEHLQATPLLQQMAKTGQRFYEW